MPYRAESALELEPSRVSALLVNESIIANSLADLDRYSDVGLLERFSEISCSERSGGPNYEIKGLGFHFWVQGSSPPLIQSGVE